MKMKRKRGWILIVEAVIAVLILFGFLFTTITKQAQQTKKADKGEYLYNIANELATKAEKNKMIRDWVLNDKCSLIREQLKMDQEVNVSVAIENAGGCGPLPPLPEEKEIYTASVIIAANLNYEPKKLKIFIWE